MVETSFNIGSGFVISLLVWWVVVGPLIASGYLNPDNSVDAILVTSLFTVTSVARSYLWRRYFTVGYNHHWRIFK